MSKGLTIFRVVLLVGILLVSPVQSQTGDGGESLEIDTDFQKTFNKELEFSKDLGIEPPEVSSYVDSNITSTDANDGYTYGDNEVVEGLPGNWTDLSMKLTGMELYTDVDGVGDSTGEIYLEIYINGNYSRYPETGWISVDQDTGFSADFDIFDSTITNHHIRINVMDEDTFSGNDQLGEIDITIDEDNLLDTGSYYIDTSTGDARVYVDITTEQHDNKLTADQLLNGFKPYLSVDDETDETEMADNVFGRLIEGNDQGTEALVFQYFFYWGAEYTPELLLSGTSFEVHKNDFEVIYMYFDKTDLSEPYRLVFNDYFYYDSLNIFDLSFPSEELVIIENGVTEHEETITTEVTEELKFLYGDEVTQTVTYKPMSAVTSWDGQGDVRVSSITGHKTLEFTVETSFHTFDLGTGGEEYSYDYDVEYISNELIQDWFSIIDETFEQGTHFWSALGIDVLKVAPFTVDVFQTFNAPYVVSGYSKVVEDTARLTKAKNAYLQMDQLLDLGVTLTFPGTLKVNYPDTTSSDSAIMLDLEYIYSEQLEVNINYEVSSFINMSYWFFDWIHDIDTSGDFSFDIDTGALASTLNSVGMGEYSSSDTPILDKYLNITDLSISPTFVGTLLDGNIGLDLWGVLDTVVTSSSMGAAKPLFSLLDLAIDGMGINAQVLLESKINTDVSVPTSGIEVQNSELEFTEDNLIQTMELQLDGDVGDHDQIEVEISDLLYNFDLSTDWSFDLDIATPLDTFIDDIHYDLGTFPSTTHNAMNATGGTFVIDIDQSFAEQLNILSIGLVSASFITMVILRRQIKV